MDAMEVLHTRGANVEARDKQGRSALLLAAMEGHSDCAEYMVEKINEYPLRLVLRGQGRQLPARWRCHLWH